MTLDITKCSLCPNNCFVDRNHKVGACGMLALPKIARVALHMWEEPIISGEKGSGTIFFSGCAMACVFCQNYEISALRNGEVYTVEKLVESIKYLETLGAHNVNFVNPTHYAHVIKQALTLYRPKIPVVYNSGGFEKVDTLKELEGLIDVYLPDFKYYDDALALKYSGRKNYSSIAKEAIDEMFRQCGTPQLENGLLKKGVVVRHLVLPGCIEDSKKVISYLYDKYGANIFLSAMCQYVPFGKASDYPEINRRLKPIEYKSILSYILKLGIKNCFVQDLESADESYIPPFKKG